MKIVDIDFLKLENRDFGIVFVNGCWDLIQVHHLNTLEYAKNLDMGKVVVAVNSDSSVKQIKGPKRPIICLKDRMRMLAALECVDYVISFEETTPYDLIMKIRPDLIVKGGDYQINDIVGLDIIGVEKVFRAPVVTGSTTSLIALIKAL